MLFLLLFFVLTGFPSGIYCISSAPGEDASKEIGISWATDTTLTGTYVLYTTLSDRDWKNAVKAKPEQEKLVTVFDGVLSEDSHAKRYNEEVRFIKCGTTLNKLKKGTRYKYKIVDSDGVQSREGQFKTAGSKQWSCCMISDIHSRPSNQSLKYASAMIDTMRVRNNSLDWVLSAGDVVSRGACYSFWKKFFDDANCAGLLWARVNGNHDNWYIESQSSDIPNDFFRETSYYPLNGYGEELGVCYHFRYGNTLFVMLNTEDMKQGAEFDAAAAWTRDVISKAKKSKDAPVFTVVCMHHQWFAGTNGKASEYRRWHKLFDEVGVDLAYAGNNHVYLRTHPLYGDKPAEKGRGTVYIQTPASDNARGRNIEPDKFYNDDKICFRWTEGKKSVGAILMSVNGNLMTLKLMNRDGEVIDQTQLKK